MNTQLPDSPQTVAQFPNKRPDWVAIKQAFVEGYVKDGFWHRATWESLETEFGVKSDTIRRRSFRQLWEKDRTAFEALREQERSKAFAKVQVPDMVSFDMLALKAATQIIVQVGEHLSRAEKTQKPLDAPMLKSLSTTLNNAHITGRLAMGSATQINETNMEVRKAAPKLENLSPEQIQTLLAAKSIMAIGNEPATVIEETK